MAIFGCFLASGLLIGQAFTPISGQTISQAQPGMTCWHDETTALATTPAASAGYTATFNQDGSVASFTAPVVPPAPTPVYVNAQTGSYTLQASDVNSSPVVITSATPVTLTIPPGLPPGIARVIQGGAGAITAVAGSGESPPTSYLGSLATAGLTAGMSVTVLSATQARIGAF